MSPMPYQDNLLTGCRMLAILGFFSVGGGPFGILATLLLLWTNCGTLSVCGLKFTVFVSLLAAVSAGFVTYSIYSFEQFWSLLNKYILSHKYVEVEVDADLEDTLHEYFDKYDWAFFVTMFSAVCWLFCAMNLVFFIKNYKKALIILAEGGAVHDETAISVISKPTSVHAGPTKAVPTMVKGYYNKPVYETTQAKYNEYLYDKTECSA